MSKANVQLVIKASARDAISKIKKANRQIFWYKVGQNIRNLFR
jgi:hypothetical protein